MARSNPGIHSIQIGDITVSALNDGQFEGAASLVVGPTNEQTEALLRDSFRAVPPRITVTCFLLEMPGRKVLIDAGTGGLFGPALGYAPAKLAALGIAPEAIDTILLTHGHGDHLGGLIDAAGAAVFGRAELVLHSAEAAYWNSDEHRERAPEASRGRFDTARRVFAAYARRTRHLRDSEAVLPGVTARHLPGHTPGHTGFRIGSGGQSLLMWTDIVHVPGVQFAHPDAGMTFDVDLDEARATRARLLDEAAADRLLVAGCHLDFPTFGHVLRHGGGYGFEPLVWAPAAAGLLA